MHPPPRETPTPPRLKLTTSRGITPPWDEDRERTTFDGWQDSLNDLTGDPWHEVIIDSVPFPLWIRLGLSPEEGYVITGMLLGEPSGTIAIGTGALNRIAVNDILDVVQLADQAQENLREGTAEFSGVVRRPGGQVKSADAIRQAARAYIYAQLAGETALIQSVANSLDASRATASRHIQRARDEGILAEERKRIDELPYVKQKLEARRFGLHILDPDGPPF